MSNEKSFAAIVREIQGNIIQVVNAAGEAGLPIDVMDMILRDISNGIHAQAEAAYQNELMQKQKGENDESGNKE